MTAVAATAPRNLLQRAANAVARSLIRMGGGGEGTWRGPFYGMTEFSNWRELGSLEDGWQKYLTLNPDLAHRIPVVASIRHLHRSAFAQLRPSHKHADADGAVTDVTTSAAHRVLLSPNDYETWSDFAARLVDQWLYIGEAAVWAVRNGRNEVESMHILPRDAWQLAIDPETRAIFYGVSNTSQMLVLADATMAIPARDILHLRWATPRHPLMGESALAAAGVAAGIHVSLSRSQAAFFDQMRRPSGVLTTDVMLSAPQMRDLRTAFDEQSKRFEQGGIPILAGGLKWSPMSITSADAEVIATLRMENEEIARTCGVPPPLVGDLSHGSVTSTETLISAWLAISLGGLIERFERALDRLFGLNGSTDWIDLDVTALLRTDLAARMEAYSKGVQGGVLTPNDARRREGLTPVDGGDQTFLQRQMVPVNMIGELAAADLKKLTAPPPPAPAQLPPPDPEMTPEEAKALAFAVCKAMRDPLESRQ
jgi:HK97 family phage portal protein